MDALSVSLPRHAVGRSEDPGDADHRRARAGQARPLRRPWATCPTPATWTRASRSALVKDGDVHVQAGGNRGRLRPAYEVREIEAKSGAVMDAIRLACEQPDWG